MLTRNANPYVHNIASQMWIYIRNIAPYIDTKSCPAVCIDLDGTVWSDDPEQQVFAGVKEALDYFFWHKWLIFFVTARRQHTRAETTRRLEVILPANHFVMYMREDDDDRPIREYKEHCRDMIRSACNVTLCVGNQLADLNHEDTECYNILIPKQEQF